MINETNIIKLVLEPIYFKKLILVKKFRRIEKNLYEITVVFPKYKKAKNLFGHVSATQISEVLIESLYCASAYSINEGSLNIGHSFEEFMTNEDNFIFRNINITGHKMLIPFEEYKYTIKIMKCELKKKFYTVFYNVDGFMRGSIECVVRK